MIEKYLFLLAIFLFIALYIILLIRCFRMGAGWGVGMILFPHLIILPLLIVRFREVRGIVSALGLIAFPFLTVVSYGFQKDALQIREAYEKGAEEYTLENYENAKTPPSIVTLVNLYIASSEALFEVGEDVGEIDNDTDIDQAFIPLLKNNHAYIQDPKQDLSDPIRFILITQNYSTVGQLPEEGLVDSLMVKQESKLGSRESNWIEDEFEIEEAGELTVFRELKPSMGSDKFEKNMFFVCLVLSVMSLVFLISPIPKRIGATTGVGVLPNRGDGNSDQISPL